MKSTLAANISAPSQARTFVATQLESAPVPQGVLIDKVVLTASELVTNSVQAGASAIEITIRVTAGRVDLVVTDDAEGWPTPTSAAIDDTAGRGLSIVDQLTDSWDVAAKKNGKAVTASWYRR